jgi:PAS domain S-box-containing protein
MLICSKVLTMNGETTKPAHSNVDQQLYRRLVEESTDITTIIDTDGVITYVSPSVTRILGYEPAALEGRPGYQFVHPDDRERNAAAVDEVLNTEGPVTVEVRFRHADGSWYWIEATLRDRLDDEFIDGILVSSRDITDRTEQDREFRALAEEYEALLNNAEDAIFFVNVLQDDDDVAFEFERLSPAYEQETGLTSEEVQGQTPRAVFGEDEGRELEANYHRCVRSREPISYQEELRVQDGAAIWQTKLAPIFTNDEITRLVGITRNVTERVQRERTLQRQKDRLDEFASVIAHDLRNPLNLALGRASLLADEHESEHLDILRRALDRMEAIVSDTLTLARQGDSIDATETVSLTDVVGTCWAMVDSTDASIEIAEEVSFEADPGRLAHVFENLFRNAIDHGGSEVTVRVGRLEEAAGIYVEDDGPGIPPERREAVLEPGHSTDDGGTGFGLTIVKRIVEAHGWHLHLTAGADGGARFELRSVTMA